MSEADSDVYIWKKIEISSCSWPNNLTSRPQSIWALGEGQRAGETETLRDDWWDLTCWLTVPMPCKLSWKCDQTNRNWNFPLDYTIITARNSSPSRKKLSILILTRVFSIYNQNRNTTDGKQRPKTYSQHSLAPLKSSQPENKKITSQLMLIQNILVFQQLLIHYRLAFWSFFGSLLTILTSFLSAAWWCAMHFILTDSCLYNWSWDL